MCVVCSLFLCTCFHRSSINAAAPSTPSLQVASNAPLQTVAQVQTFGVSFDLHAIMRENQELRVQYERLKAEAAAVNFFTIKQMEERYDEQLETQADEIASQAAQIDVLEKENKALRLSIEELQAQLSG